MRLVAERLKTLAAPWTRSAFARLVRHFTSVIISTGQDSGGADLNLSIGGLLALLAVPGAFFSFTLFDKYSSFLQWLRGGRPIDGYLVSIPDKYFFIVFAMAITGGVTTLKWDRIFPSRQDYGNLAPLPLPAWRIYAANLVAILILAGLFAIDVNAGSTMLFPLVVVAGSGGNYFGFVAAHAATVILASAFTFFGCFALIGALVSCLPERIFRAISLWVRLAILFTLMAFLLTSFTVPNQIIRLAAHPNLLVRWLPPVWFLAFYQSLQGRASGELITLAALAWKSTAAVVVAAMFFGALGYKRYFLRIPESTDSRQSSSRQPFWIASALLDRWFLKSPFQRACYHFSLRALLRSETHCIIFGAFAGLGVITAIQLISSIPTGPRHPPLGPVPYADLLAVPLCAAYFLIAGLRFVFEIPAGVTANWVYRLTLHRANHEAAQVARKLTLSFLVPSVILPCLIVSCWRWGTAIGIPHTVFVMLWSVALMELLLLRFNKIPFTCNMPPFENNAIVLILAYVIGFFCFTTLASAIEHWMLLDPIRWMAVPVFFAAAWYGLRRGRHEADDFDARLVYDVLPEAAVQTLNISH